MLQAQNGRQLNLAANVVQSFFSKKDIQVKHSDALLLVSQLIVYPSYHAARASMQRAAKGVASDVSTWRQLAHAIGTMNEDHLDMLVEVADSRLFREVSSFGRDATVRLSTPGKSGSVERSVDYPVLLVTDNAEDRSPGLSTEEELASEAANRVRHQFEVGTGKSSSLAETAIREYGLRDAIVVLNNEYGLNISVGRYVAYSESQQGFWNESYGFVFDKASATGFDGPEVPVSQVFCSDLEMVLFSEAVDVDPDKEDKFADQVRGKPFSRYQWPVQYARLWEEVSPRISELLEATKKLVEAKSFTGQIVAREHVDGTGEQLVLELYSGVPDAGDAVFGGRLVFALADFQRSGFLNAAGLGVFLEIPGREPSLAYSLNIERRGDASFATEARYFFEDLLHQTPKKLADELMLHANFEHGSSTD